MTYNEFISEYDFNRSEPEEYNYFTVCFDHHKTNQQFIDYTYSTISNLQDLWYHRAGNIFYVMLRKPDMLPDGFAPYVEVIEYTATDTGDSE